MKGSFVGKKKQFSAVFWEVFMVRAFKTLTVMVAFLILITGCQAMTGETMGQNIDDGTLTSYVKTKLASDKLVTLTRVGVETNNGVVDRVPLGRRNAEISSSAKQ